MSEQVTQLTARVADQMMRDNPGGSVLVVATDPGTQTEKGIAFMSSIDVRADHEHSLEQLSMTLLPLLKAMPDHTRARLVSELRKPRVMPKVNEANVVDVPKVNVTIPLLLPLLLPILFLVMIGAGMASSLLAAMNTFPGSSMPGFAAVASFVVAAGIWVTGRR